MPAFRSERSCADRAAQLRGLDVRVLQFLRTRGHAPAVEHAVGRFSALGEHGGLWLAIGAAGAALDRERRPQWLRTAGSVAGVYALNTAIKLVVARHRPVLDGLPPLARTPTQLSFPSSHAATAFAGAGGYARLGLPAGPLYALAIATAVSRPYLGLHYPSDVIAGAGLGLAVSALAAKPASRPTRRSEASTSSRASAPEASTSRSTPPPPLAETAG